MRTDYICRCPNLLDFPSFSDWEGLGVLRCKANQPLDVLECTQEANSAHENVGNKVMCLGLPKISREYLRMCCNGPKYSWG